MSTITLDPSIVWFDSNQIIFENKRKDFLTPDEKKRKALSNKGIMEVQISIGSLDSKIGSDQLLNSDVYNKDDKIISHKAMPFSDDKRNKGNKITTSFNPKKIVKTYGQNNADQIFQSIADEPFEDVENMQDMKEYFKLSEDLKYPRFYNSSNLSQFNGSISVFETIETIDGTLLTEGPIKGIKGDLIKNGTDTRNRSLSLSQEMTINEIINNNSIESFSDEEIEDLNLQSTSSRSTFQVGVVPVLTNKTLYYTESRLLGTPFSDNFDQSYDLYKDLNSGISHNKVFVGSTGYDLDMSFGGKPDSIAYTGEIN